MDKTCILLADSTRARFITLAMPDDPVTDGGARLVEHHDLVNPERDAPERALFSDRQSRGHASPAGAAHALDDHRERHLSEVDRRFARRVAEELELFVAREQVSRVLLVAEPRTLGVLRPEIDRAGLGAAAIEELGENLSQLPLGQVQSILSLRGAVPAAEPPEVGVFRPRGQPVLTR